MTDALLLGIDIGTGSTKGVLATPSGRVVAVRERPHGLSLPHPGWAEHDAESVWWADVVSICRELAAEYDPARIRGLCVSGIGPVLLVADEAGHPLRPAILYGIDARAVDEIDELEDELGAGNVVTRGGSRLTTQAIGPKLRWLSKHEPAIFERSRKLFMASSFAVFKFTGEYVLDHHSASQCDPMYDIHAQAWSRDWATLLAGPITLPRLAWPAEIAGLVNAAAARDTGLTVGTPVAVGTIDAWAEALSVGVSSDGQMMVMYGSTMFFVAPVRRPISDARLWCTTGTDPQTWSLAGGMGTSGSLTGWLRDLTGSSFEALTASAAQSPPGAHGLLVLPYFAGERTPYFDPDARGVIAGLTLRHGAGDLYRAVLEAIGYGVRQHIDIFRSVGAPPEQLVAVGGGTRESLWPQIVSDITGRAQIVPRVTVGAAYGDALLAARGCALADAYADWASAARLIEPDRSFADHYDELYGNYLSLYSDTRDTVHTLARLGADGR